MDEKKLLENFAKVLNAENLLANIESKKVREEKLLDQLNTTFSNFIANNKEHVEVIEQQIVDVIPPMITEDAPGTAGRQPEPELPKKDIVNRSVEMLSKVSQKDIQKAADELPDGIQKELDIIKKSIADFHRFAQRHSQMGGGGEIWLAKLQDVNRSTIMDGLYLRYDAASKKFVFDSPLGPGGVQVDWNQSNTSAPDYIKDKPDLTVYAYANSLVQADWNEANTLALDYIKNKPLLAMDSNGNISVSATMVSNNEYTLGTLAQPWAGLYLSSNSLNILPDTGNVSILIENNNGIMRLLTGGFAVNDLTQTYELFKVDTAAGLTYVKSRGAPAVGSSVLNVSANPSNNVIPLVSTVVGGVIHATGSNSGPTLITVDNIDNTNTATQSASAFVMRKFRGTVDNVSPVLNNDVLGTVTAVGYGGPTGAYTSSGLPSTAQNWIRWRSIEDHTLTAQGAQLEFNLIPTGSIVAQNTLIMTASGNQPGLQFIQTNTGITFTDGSFQNTAFNSNNGVTSITVGTGLTQSNTVGAVGIQATGVLTVSGTNNQIIVANVGQNITLSTPQNLNTNATVQFNTLTVQNLNVLGNTTVANTQSLASKILYLAYNSSNSSQIDGGGIVLGNSSSSYERSILYNLSIDAWTFNTANVVTQNLYSNYVNGNNLVVSNAANFGAAFAGYDYPNAVIQIDQNVPTYSQVVEQNHSNSINASTDYVAVNDVGNDSIHYIDLGINSSTWANSQWTINGPNDGYLYIDSGNLSIGTATAGQVLTFFTGGTLANNLRATINDSGLTVVNNVTAASFTGNLTGNVIGNLSGTANNALYLGGIAANQYAYANQIVAQVQSDWNEANTAKFDYIKNKPNLTVYQTTAGLAANVLTLTSNNTNYVGSVSAANVVSNAQLQANLANYQTTAGLSANVAKLTSNNSLYLGGYAANQYAFANQIIAQVQSDWNEANTSAVDYIKNKPDLSVYGNNAPYIEAYSRANTFLALTSSPQLLIPDTSTGQGITYSNTTGVFTFTYGGNYSLTVEVNVQPTASQQRVYIYSESNTGSGWAVIPNSGKSYLLNNSLDLIQIVYPQSVHRSAGQQIRYWIYSSDNKTSLVTTTLPGLSGANTVYVPAVRIQYA